MLAILMDAINTLRRGTDSKQNRQVYAITYRWLRSNEDDYCFTFVSICDQFDWTPSVIRKNIMQYLKQHHEKEDRKRREQVRQGWTVGGRKVRNRVVRLRFPV